MALFLKIIGIIFLILLFAIIALILFVRHFFKKVNEQTMSTKPIVLVEDPGPKWLEKVKVKVLTDEICRLGFEPTKVYTPVMMGIRLAVFANRERNQFAAVYYSPIVLSMEFSAETPEGLNMNVTTDKLADTYKPKPNKIIRAYPSASPAELYPRFVELIADAKLNIVPDEKFTETLQKQLNDELKNSYKTNSMPLWQDGLDDFLQRWKKHGTDDELRKTYSISVSHQLNDIRAQIAAQLSNSTGISTKQSGQYTQALLVYNPRVEKNGFLEHLKYLFACAPELYEKKLQKFADESSDTAALFERITQSFPELVLTKIASVTEPIEADVYRYSIITSEGPGDL